MALDTKYNFEVMAPIADVWEILSDPPQIVPCLPGAKLTEKLDENTYKGEVGFRFGQVSANFEGKVDILEMNENDHSIKLRAIGDQVGSVGQANADIDFSLKSKSEDITEIEINTSIGISGKLAHLGGGMIQSIAKFVFQRFSKSFKDMVENS